MITLLPFTHDKPTTLEFSECLQSGAPTRRVILIEVFLISYAYEFSRLGSDHKYFSVRRQGLGKYFFLALCKLAIFPSAPPLMEWRDAFQKGTHQSSNRHPDVLPPL